MGKIPASSCHFRGPRTTYQATPLRVEGGLVRRKTTQFTLATCSRALLPFLLVSVVLGLWSGAARAETVIWTWEGEVTEVDSGGPFAEVPIGTPLSGTVVYDDTAPDQTPDPLLGSYFLGGTWPLPGIFTVDVGGDAYSWSHLGITVDDGYNNPFWFDQVIGTSGPGGDIVYDVVLTGDYIDSDALPSVSVLNDDLTFPMRVFQVLDLTQYPAIVLLRGNITTFNASVETVAVPSISLGGLALLAGLVLGVVGWARRTG